MFYQILPKVDLRPRVLVSVSEPPAVSATVPPQPKQPLPSVVVQPVAEKWEKVAEGPTKSLIKAIERRPVLYKKHTFACSRERKIAWDEVAKVVNVSVAACQQKWKTLRDFYTRKKKMEMEETDCTKSFPKNKWPYMQDLSFIDPYLRFNNMNRNQKLLPTNANLLTTGNLPLTESNVEDFILGSDSPNFEENNNESVDVKLESSLDDQSQEVSISSESVDPPLQSPSTSCEKEDSSGFNASCNDASSPIREELVMCTKKKSKKRKADDDEDILEVAISKLLSEPPPPPDDYLDLRTKALCCLIRERNLSMRDQLKVLQKCEELVINYKMESN